MSELTAAQAQALRDQFNAHAHIATPLVPQAAETQCQFCSKWVRLLPAGQGWVHLNDDGTVGMKVNVGRTLPDDHHVVDVYVVVPAVIREHYRVLVPDDDFYDDENVDMLIEPRTGENDLVIEVLDCIVEVADTEDKARTVVAWEDPDGHHYVGEDD